MRKSLVNETMSEGGSAVKAGMNVNGVKKNNDDENNNASLKSINEAGTKVKLEIQSAMSSLHDALRARELTLMNQVDTMMQAERSMLVGKQVEKFNKMNIKETADDDDDDDDDGSDDDDDDDSDDDDDDSDTNLRSSLQLKLVGSQGELRRRILSFGKVKHAKKRNESFEVITKDNSDFYNDLVSDVTSRDVDVIREEEDDDDVDVITSSSSSSSPASSFVQVGLSKKEMKNELKMIINANRLEAQKDKMIPKVSYHQETTTNNNNNNDSELLKRWLKTSENDNTEMNQSHKFATSQSQNFATSQSYNSAVAVPNPLEDYLKKISERPMEYWLTGARLIATETGNKKMKMDIDRTVSSSSSSSPSVHDWKPFKFQMNNNNGVVVARATTANNDNNDSHKGKNTADDDKLKELFDKFLYKNNHSVGSVASMSTSADIHSAFTPFRFNFAANNDNNDNADVTKSFKVTANGDKADKSISDVAARQQQQQSFTPYSFKFHPDSSSDRGDDNNHHYDLLRHHQRHHLHHNHKTFKLEKKLSKWLSQPQLATSPTTSSSSSSSSSSSWLSPSSSSWLSPLSPPPSSSRPEKLMNEAVIKMKELYDSPLQMWLR